MARPLRIQFENAYYHVTCRGNSRQIIFSSVTDRVAFLDLLGRSSEVYQTEIRGEMGCRLRPFLGEGGV